MCGSLQDIIHPGITISRQVEDHPGVVCVSWLKIQADSSSSFHSNSVSSDDSSSPSCFDLANDWISPYLGTYHVRLFSTDSLINTSAQK